MVVLKCSDLFVICFSVHCGLEKGNSATWCILLLWLLAVGVMPMFVLPCVSLLLSLAASYPSSMSCDFACMANYGPGTNLCDVMAVWWLTANGICPPCRCQLRLHGHCQRRCQQWCHLCNCHRCADRRFHRRQQLHHHGATAKNAGELFGQIATRMEYMSVFFYI